MAERPGVVVYFDIEPALKMLDDTQRGRLFSAIIDYAHYSVLPTFNDPLLDMAWSFVKPSIDKDGIRYEKTVHSKKIAGITSDFRRNYAPKHNIDPSNEDALQAYINQKLSTSVEDSQPNAITTTTSATTVTPSTNTITAAIADGTEGVGGEPLNAEDFEKLRRLKIAAVLKYGKT